MNRNEEYLKTFNSLFYQQNNIYAKLVKKTGLSDSYYQILYLIRNDICLPYANKIVDFTFGPKQTINSAIKKMEKEGLVELIKQEKSKNKKIVLTKKGEEYCEKTIDKIVELELKSFENISDEECEEYFKVMKKFNEKLEKEIETNEQ